MNAPHDFFDDETAEALLGGGGRDVDPELAELLGEVRDAYTSTPPEVGAELAALIGMSVPAAGLAHRRGRMRSHLAARFAAATVAVVAAMSGLAIAGALPAPLSLGDGADEATTTTTTVADPTTTTTVDDSTTTTVDDGTTTIIDDNDAADDNGDGKDNHGAEVSAVARDKSLHGCEHGRAVSAVASGKVNDKECPDHEAEADDGDDDESTPSSVGDDSDGGESQGNGRGNGAANGRGHNGDDSDD